jgi:hypothetical protein
MHVFSSRDTTPAHIAHEQFAGYYRNASVVSMESLGQYLQRVRDTFSSVKSAIVPEQDKFVAQTLSNKYETLHLAKQVKYTDFRADLVSRPETFSSLYVDYLEDLTEIAQATHASVLKSIDTLKIAVASFINDYQEGQVDSLYGARYFQVEKKVIEAQQDRNKKHYKAPQNKTKTEVQTVIKSMTDFEKIYALIDACAATLNQPNATHLEKSVRDVTDLIDALVEQNLRTGVLVKSQGAKKELVGAIDQTARAVEFYTALHAEFFGVCSGFKTLTDALIARG